MIFVSERPVAPDAIGALGRGYTVATGVGAASQKVSDNLGGSFAAAGPTFDRFADPFERF